MPTAYLILIFLLGLVFFASAIGGLVWASKRGQLRDFEKGSRVIFDEEEPEGTGQDQFPGRRVRPRRDIDRRRRMEPEREGTTL